MKTFAATLVLLLSAAHSWAGVVADYSDTHNFPGFIDLDPRSLAYQGPALKRQDYGDGVIRETPSQLIASYLVDGKIDGDKIRDLIREIRSVQENARIAWCQSEQAEVEAPQTGCKNGFPSEKLSKKWQKKSVNIAYGHAINLFSKALELAGTVSSSNLNTASAQPFLEAFFDAFEVYQGVTAEDSQMGRYSGNALLAVQVAENLKPAHITKDRMEAANLMRPQSPGGNVFYSPEELEALKEGGTDISLLNPPDSGFWQNPRKSIRAFDTARYDGGEMPYLKKELSEESIQDLLDPNTPIQVEYKLEAPKGTGVTPKLTVKFGGSTLKVKFTTDRMGRRNTLDLFDETMKIISGLEVNTENVVNNLAAALGFSVDGTYYKDVVQVYFPEEVYEQGGFEQEHEKLVQLLTGHFSPSYNLASALKNIKVDSKGRKYFELKNVQLERKANVDTDINIGFFVRKGLGKSLKREHRAFALFLAWIWDVDVKDSNTTLKLVPHEAPGGHTEYKVVMSNSDMGYTLGSSRPNFYNFDLIKEVRKDGKGNPEYLKLNYRRVYPNELLNAITFDDARWLGRLIGQLSDEQVENAFLSGGYTPVVAKYYAGLMLKKRNELLDALNLMGEFPPAAGFNGTVKGHEEFFVNGMLTDPQNKLWDPGKEPFPPYWGTSSGKVAGEPQEYLVKLTKIRLLTAAGDLIYNSYLSKAGVSNDGFKFSEIIMSDTDLGKECKGKCFFQGFNAGVDSFIPWRFIIENPDAASKHPFLIVDIFRLGFFIGGNLQFAFNLGIPASAILGIGGNHYQISEFIKVRPVDKLGDLWDEKLNLLKMPVLNFKKARRQVISNLRENEYLIQSHYVGLKAKAQLSIYTPVTPFISPSASLRGDTLIANRVTYLGKGKSGLHVGWDKVKEARLNGRFNLLDYYVSLPVLDHERRKLKDVQRVFSFDRELKEDQEVLWANVNHVIPSGIPERYALSQRTTSMTESRFSFGISELFRRTSTRGRIGVDYQDADPRFSGSNTNYLREVEKKRLTKRLGLHTSKYKIQASLNARREVFARIKLEGVFENMTKAKFKKVLVRYTPMLPDNFIQFDPDAVRENFGTLELDIETIFPEKGLREIFNPAIRKFGLCKVYSKVHHYGWSDKECLRLNDINYGLLHGLGLAKARYLKFWRNYVKVRVEFWRLLVSRDRGERKELYGKLKSMVDLMTDNGSYGHQTMKLFLALTGRSNYFRRASMYSPLSSFPGQTGTIREDAESAGSYRPSPHMRGDRPEEEFKLFMDSIQKTVQKMFYNNQYVNESFSI